MNLKPILQAILEDYALPLNGDHGVAHWARVLENGLRLAEETGANVEVVSLFAVLHDSRRINEVTDPEHGSRAAEFALELRGSVFDLDDNEFRLLYRACELSEHTASMPAILHFLHGEATLTLGDDTVEAQPGTWIHMEPNLKHSVQTKTPVVMLLLLLKM